MPGEHRGEAGGRGLEIELREVMKHVEGVGADLDDVIGGKVRRPRTFVVVAADGANGSESTKRVQNRACTDVPAVADQIASAELLDGFGPHEPVRVRNHTDDGAVHGLSSCPPQLPLALPRPHAAGARRR